MNKRQRDLINALNAGKSTGPTSPAGLQRASMNAFKHGLTGNRMILQAHEHEAYERLAGELTKDLSPKTELERQLVQKLIDCHTRLNRIAALDGNILNFGLTQNESDADHGGDQGSDQNDAIESIAAQCRSWIENADSFEKLGRYESRISRQMLQYTKELERLQADRTYRESIAAVRASYDKPAVIAVQQSETKLPDIEGDITESGSFRQTPPEVPNPQNNGAPPAPRANILEYQSR
jgi:hypothetical protein